jgi:HD-like signal output (HDOD) protein
MDPQARLNEIKQLRNLPTLPTVFHKVLAALDDDKSSAQTLKDAIIHDQSLSAKVLSVANSAYFSGGKSVDDIADAIVVLGLEMLKSVVLSVSVFKTFPPSEKGAEFDRESFWLHSILAANAGKMIAKAAGYANFEQGFLFGLLHDIGKVVLDHHYHDEYSDVCLDARFNACPIEVSEQKILQITHAQVGQVLGNYWKFPPALLDAILYHHTLQNAPEESVVPVAIAHLADYLADTTGFGNSGTSAKVKYDSSVLDILKLDATQVDALQDELSGNAEQIQSIL